jgi:hypothetical protein
MTWVLARTMERRETLKKRMREQNEKQEAFCCKMGELEVST